jgi:Zn-dependent metalloprotease
MRLLANLIVSAVLAFPFASEIKNFGPDLNPTYNTFHLHQPIPDHNINAETIATNYMQSQNPSQGVKVTSSYKSFPSGIQHVNLIQTFNGLEVTNAVANVNMDNLGRLLSVGESFYQPNNPEVYHDSHSIFFSFTNSRKINTEFKLDHLQGLEALFIFLGYSDYSMSETQVEKIDESYMLTHPL